MCILLVHVACAMCTNSPLLLLCGVSGVEDEMALALELSRREGQSHHSPKRPGIQNRPPASPFSAATQRSFSSTPFYNYGETAGSSDDDEDDEDLQMALACSLSELEAQQRAAATDFISGAGGGGPAVSSKTFKTKKVYVSTCNTIVNTNKNSDEGQFKMGSGLGDKWEKTGKGTSEPDFSPESPTTSNTTPVSQSSEELEPAIKNSDAREKKKKKCGCIVC